MNYIIDFYKELDIFNLIIFWGVIIIVVLLLIFSIILINKNKKLKYMLRQKEQELDESHEELAIIKQEENNKDQIIEKKVVDEPITLSPEPQNNEASKDIKEGKIEELNNQISEEKFVAEEHVIEYNKIIPNITNNQQNDDEHQSKEPTKIVEENISNHYTKPGLYQKNVLREMSLNQTSPIGIIKPKDQSTVNSNNALDLYSTLNTKDDEIKNTTDNKVYNSISKLQQNKTTHEINNNINILTDNHIIENNNTKPKIEEPKKQESYLTEVSQKLSEATKSNDIVRTEYELKQEEEAIISYEELMRKKDSIKIIDEEDAVISIEELMQKKNHDDKLYNITEEEANDKFISELKNFRGDL